MTSPELPVTVGVDEISFSACIYSTFFCGGVGEHYPSLSVNVPDHNWRTSLQFTFVKHSHVSQYTAATSPLKAGRSVYSCSNFASRACQA